MLWSEHSTKVAGIGFISVVLTLSGCGTIGGILLGGALSLHESAEDDNLCTKRCVSLKGEGYVRCHERCMCDERRRRSERKAEYERDRQNQELVNRVAEEARKNPHR